jgi:hypothetical protein
MVLDVARNALPALPEELFGLAKLHAADIDHNRLCSASAALRQWADRVAGSWQSTQTCASAEVTGDYRYYPVPLGDTVECDGQQVSFLAYRHDGNAVSFLLAEGGRVGVYREHSTVGLEHELSGRVERFVEDERGAWVEVRTRPIYMERARRLGEYELVGLGARAETSELGEVRLVSVSDDSAELRFSQGASRVVGTGDTVYVSRGDVRWSVACRWVFSGGRGRLWADTAADTGSIDAVGITISVVGEPYRPATKRQLELLESDPAAMVYIYDLGGRVLVGGPFSRLEELSSGMPNGSYVRRMQGGGEVVWDRFFVNR